MRQGDLKNKARVAIAGLAVSGALALVADFEGFSNKAYIPVKNDVATIGYGQTFYSDGRRVRLGDWISEKAAKNELKALIEKKYLTKLKECVKVPLSQGEFDAFLSLMYNIGDVAFCRSTLVRKLNVKDYAGACSEILRWKYAGGRVLRGLQNRRLREYEICMKG